MLAALLETGWRNYSLFLDDDGLLIGYFESESTFDEVLERMAATEVNARWQAAMAPFFDEPSQSPDAALRRLPQVFHLETQWATG